MASRRRRFRARPKPQPKRPPANEEIRAPQVRLIGAEGEQLGVMTTKKAIAEAEKLDMDIVVVAEKADPPVARIQDLGKFMYEKRKKQAKQRVKSKSSEVKGIRIGFKTGAHDWELRLNQADGFLEQGHKVKLEMRLRGRERYRTEIAIEKIREFVAAIPGGAKIEGAIGRTRGNLSAMLTR